MAGVKLKVAAANPLSVGRHGRSGLSAREPGGVQPAAADSRLVPGLEGFTQRQRIAGHRGSGHVLPHHADLESRRWRAAGAGDAGPACGRALQQRRLAGGPTGTAGAGGRPAAQPGAFRRPRLAAGRRRRRGGPGAGRRSAKVSRPTSSAARAGAPTVENDRTVLKEVPLVWTSFAEAGQTGSSMLVWLPSKSQLQRTPRFPFLFAKESCSRPGSVNGSIADGDRSTFRTTGDGHMQLEDWFAVQREEPATINAVVFAHGRACHDGGWWDTAKGKPRIQILATADGSWEDVGLLESYPQTDATKRPRIPSDGKCLSAVSVPQGGCHSHRRRRPAATAPSRALPVAPNCKVSTRAAASIRPRSCRSRNCRVGGGDARALAASRADRNPNDETASSFGFRHSSLETAGHAALRPAPRLHFRATFRDRSYFAMSLSSFRARTLTLL